MNFQRFRVNPLEQLSAVNAPSTSGLTTPLSQAVIPAATAIRPERDCAGTLKAFALGMSLALLVGCGGGSSSGSDDEDTPPKVPITSNKPIANADTASVKEGSNVAGNVSSNDEDLIDSPITYSVATGPSNGQLQLDTDGQFTYTPNAGFFGADNFAYTVTDGDGDASTTQVSITVNRNILPSGSNDNFTVEENDELIGDVSLNDSGLDDTPVTFAAQVDPSNGVLDFDSDGSFSYTPNADFFGSDGFIYSIIDVDGDVSSAQVFITVEEAVDTISGLVTDSDFFSGAIESAEVRLLHTNETSTTDENGEFSFEITQPLTIAEEFLAVAVSADGYRPREFNVAVNDNATLQLDAINSYSYSEPVQLDDGLQTGSIDDAGIDAALISQLMNKFVQDNEAQGYREAHSILVYKDGALVLEEYNIGNDDFIRFEDNIARDGSRPDKKWSRTDKHYIASVNKALTATVAGIAMDASNLVVDDKISTLVPEKAAFFNDPNKAAVSIHHILTMQLGFTWDEWSSNDLALLWKSRDFANFLLVRANAGPESAWVYNSAGANLLMRGLNNTVPGGIRTWAHDNFYAKLGIVDYDWIDQPGGIPEGAARMHMRPRDMLKVGVTYLNGGVWNNEQVIPAAWVDEVSKVQVNGFAGDYSYYFWHRDLAGKSYISADGDGGQYINIFPDENMVIVITQGNYLEFPLYVNQANDMMSNYIFPALQ